MCSSRAVVKVLEILREREGFTREETEMAMSCIGSPTNRVSAVKLNSGQSPLLKEIERIEDAFDKCDSDGSGHLFKFQSQLTSAPGLKAL